MISTKEYKGKFQVGDLIWYSIKGEGAEEDLGYIHKVFVENGIKKYKVTWFIDGTEQPESEETKDSIKNMPDSYIFPVL